jgi:hypothetical protein
MSRAFVRSVLLLLLPASAAGAGDLAGTWSGSITCRSENESGRSTQRREIELQISQPGGPGTNPLAVALGPLAASGQILPSASDPDAAGVGAFISCGTSAGTDPLGFSLVELFRYRVDANGRGSLRTRGVRVGNRINVAHCTGSFVRISSEDPGVSPCP